MCGNENGVRQGCVRGSAKQTIFYLLAICCGAEDSSKGILGPPDPWTPTMTRQANVEATCLTDTQLQSSLGGFALSFASRCDSDFSDGQLEAGSILALRSHDIHRPD